jgi:hypothetical protein
MSLVVSAFSAANNTASSTPPEFVGADGFAEGAGFGRTARNTHDATEGASCSRGMV